MFDAYMDCSTAHLTEATRRWLEERGPADVPGTMLTGEYGWFIYANDPEVEMCDGTGWPEDLKVVLRYATEKGARYVLFDQDGPVTDMLPNYEAV